MFGVILRVVCISRMFGSLCDMRSLIYCICSFARRMRYCRVRFLDSSPPDRFQSVFGGARRGGRMWRARGTRRCVVASLHGTVRVTPPNFWEPLPYVVTHVPK